MVPMSGSCVANAFWLQAASGSEKLPLLAILINYSDNSNHLAFSTAGKTPVLSTPTSPKHLGLFKDYSNLPQGCNDVPCAVNEGRRSPDLRSPRDAVISLMCRLITSSAGAPKHTAAEVEEETTEQLGAVFLSLFFKEATNRQNEAEPQANESFT
ncbi:hypothetical protein Anapl_16087 [Anas platyrhynchos]|uniref:Uncharacterized protein n=1 Tax=Anas platyrhynchos TaxID=8839 RepID=R0JHN0_ANAPL|nr:hypothetical protein Anapl_16087 [Anas platyrhynchos]